MKERLDLARVDIQPANLRARRPAHRDEQKQRPEFDAALGDHRGNRRQIGQHMARDGGVDLRLQTEFAAPIENF